MCRNAVNLAKFDFVCQLNLVGGLERSLECQGLVNDTACTPDVAFFVVALLLDLLRTHVVGRSNMSLCED